MKLYGEFSKEDWLHAIGIGRNDVSESFIIHGEWNHAENLKLWKEQLSDDMLLPKWNTGLVGKQNGVLTGFANVYGSPMAAAICHHLLLLERSVLFRQDILAVCHKLLSMAIFLL